MTVAAAGAAIANAIKASGVIVRLEPETFQQLVGRMEDPLIVRSKSTFFGERFHYLTGYKGLAFYTKTKTALMLPGRAEVIEAKSISMPE
ncbi:MAG: hypothetical protein HY337_03440 [Gemmatimonadetes bacterium]|nr:hypothetical protein [Gemmatimonadota bacterium]